MGLSLGIRHAVTDTPLPEDLDALRPSGLDMLLGMVVGAAAAVGMYLLIMRFIARKPGLGLAGPGKLRELVLGLGIGVALISLAVGVIAVLGGYRVHGLRASELALDGVLMGLAVGIGPGFIEEIFFRGFLVRLIDSWAGSWIAIAITSVTFGLIHVGNSEATVFGAVAIMFEAGILLGAAYLLTRRLWLAIGIHVGWNAVQGGLYSSDVSGTGDPNGLLDATWHGSDLLTGGSMGMEASVVTLVVATAAGVAMLVLAHRHGRILSRFTVQQPDA
jgi:membrane protease YdiL (CAAX protease family)